MNRLSLPIAAALTATAALLLTACGGSDDKPKANDKIAGADEGDKKSASPSTSSTGSVGRPKVELPADVKDAFEGWKTGDPTKDAALADTAARIDATNEAIVRGDTDAPALPFYYRDKALADAVEWVQAYVDADLAFTGTTRYFAPEVTLADGESATVVYCSDESRGFNKNRKTGKVDKTPSTESPFVLYNTRLEKNKRGVWQASNLISKRGHKTCTG